MDVALQRKALVDYDFDEREVEEFVNDPRLFALAKIKFQNKEESDHASWENKKIIKEMVGYLLN